MARLRSPAGQDKLPEGAGLYRFVAVFAAKDNDAWMCTYFELDVIYPRFGGDDNSIFLVCIVHNFRVGRCAHAYFTNVFNVEGR